MVEIGLLREGLKISLIGEMWDGWFFGCKKVVVSHEKIGRLIVLLRVSVTVGRNGEMSRII